MPKSKLKTKTAVISGGTKGIGFIIAKILARKGYNLVLFSRHISSRSRIQKELECYGIKTLILKADVSKVSNCQLVVKKALREFLNVDLLVNCASIQGPVGKLWTNKIKDWERTISINLLGTFYMSYLLLLHMLKNKRGVIINLSGGGAAYGRPLFSAYSSSKTAMLRLTENLSLELKGTGIRVYAVAPGAVWTNMTKSVLKHERERLDKKTLAELLKIKSTGGTSEEKIQDLVWFLVSKKPSQLSGKLIHVNELDKLQESKKTLRAEGGFLRRVNQF